VEVVSRISKDQPAYCWSSDGTGDFEVSQVDDADFERGTRIVINLKPECESYSKKADIERIIQRYSNFITFPIHLNGEHLNLVQAIWSRDKSGITSEEYSKFFEFIANTKLNFKYKLHYLTDAPLRITALLFVPSSHAEKFGITTEDTSVNLYCKKILIK